MNEQRFFEMEQAAILAQRRHLEAIQRQLLAWRDALQARPGFLNSLRLRGVNKKLAAIESKLALIDRRLEILREFIHGKGSAADYLKMLRKEFGIIPLLNTKLKLARWQRRLSQKQPRWFRRAR